MATRTERLMAEENKKEGSLIYISFTALVLAQGVSGWL